MHAARLDSSNSETTTCEVLCFAAIAAHHIANDLLLCLPAGDGVGRGVDRGKRPGQMALAAELLICMAGHGLLKPVVVLAIATRVVSIGDLVSKGSSACTRNARRPVLIRVDRSGAWPACTRDFVPVHARS